MNVKVMFSKMEKNLLLVLYEKAHSYGQGVKGMIRVDSWGVAGLQLTTFLRVWRDS